MRFEFATANRIVFGPGVVRDVAPLAANLGRRPYWSPAAPPERAEPLLAQLRNHSLEPALFSVAGEPTVDSVLAGVAQARAPAATW